MLGECEMQEYEERKSFFETLKKAADEAHEIYQKYRAQGHSPDNAEAMAQKEIRERAEARLNNE